MRMQRIAYEFDVLWTNEYMEGLIKLIKSLQEVVNLCSFFYNEALFDGFVSLIVLK